MARSALLELGCFGHLGLPGPFGSSIWHRVESRLGASAAYQWQHVTGCSPRAVLFWAGVLVTLLHMRACVWSGECQTLQAAGDPSAQFEKGT